MSSILDSNFQLPIIEPLRKNDQFLTSANKPLLITGVDTQTGERADYVVKLLKAERMSEAAAMRELLATFIAIELEISVPEPAIINITNEFVELLRGDPAWQTTSESIGYNFGSKYVDKLQTIAINQPIPKTLIPDALEIFVFDVFIQNSDRTHIKPNMITDGRTITILDHEIAFGFVFELPFSRNKQPWSIREADKLWIEKHCLYNQLKGQIFETDALITKLGCLNNAFWNMAWQLIPKPWKDEKQFDEIRTFLSQIVSRRAEFLKNVQLLLA